ncbi:MAG: methyltransferase domain-containing protein, partial [Clostridiales bacterium]|nr:methyltransferase domain-containing protein [Clostridiales bacterium]
MRDKICIVCANPLTEEPLMVLDGMPASAQDIPSKEELMEEKGISLNLCQCSRCGLVQFDCQPVEYYKDVIRSGGYSTTMVNLRTRQYRHLIETYHLEGKKLIEAGCGQGEFLSVLANFPVEAYGIENREPLVAMAREKGLNVWKQFAKEGEILAPDDGSVKGPYDGFLSFNFLEHQPNPVSMLRCLADNLQEEGIGLITVPSLEYILEYDGYYELIRDHLAYYTFDTLALTVEEAGFEVLEEEMINRDTLSIIVRKKKQPAKREDSKKAVKIDVSGLIKSQDTIGNEIDQLIKELEAGGKRLAIWGASHQGFTLASTTRIGAFAEYMIDSAPFKQGKYAPASHLPIVPSEHFMTDPVDAILIVAPGYTEEIAG